MNKIIAAIPDISFRNLKSAWIQPNRFAEKLVKLPLSDVTNRSVRYVTGGVTHTYGSFTGEVEWAIDFDGFSRSPSRSQFAETKLRESWSSVGGRP